MLNSSHTRFKKIRVYAALAVAPIIIAGVTTLGLPPLTMAQSEAEATTFTLPTRVDQGTTVKIDGSSSVATINEALKERFEGQFKGTDVDIQETGSAEALTALLEGEVDLVAMGRSLTADEKAQGFVEVPLARHKIAVFVSPDNAYAEDLTIEQFGRIFRGEVQDWSELGDAAGPIRFVDRPESSDTRQAFQNYPVFQSAPFQTGATAETVSDDQTDEVIDALGEDGIGYAIVDQVKDRSDVRILSMHQVMPTDARYPFSQPLTYVYKGPEANPAVQAFLGYATAPENASIVESARLAGAEAGVDATDESNVTAETNPEAGTTGDAADSLDGRDDISGDTDDETARSGGLRWWPWLLLPLLGAGLWWLLGRGGGGAAPVAAGGVAPIAAGADKSQLILTPRDCKTAYAYWELSDRDQNRLNQNPRRTPSLRLYEDSLGNNVSRARPGSARHLIKQVNCATNTQDQHFDIPVDDRDYFVELGYESDGQWTVLERSDSVRVPACTPSQRSSARAGIAAVPDSRMSTGTGTTAATRTPTGTTTGTKAGMTAMGTAVAGTAAAGAAAGTAAGAAAWGNKRTESNSGQTQKDQIILVPHTQEYAYAYWEVNPASKQILRDSGGQTLKLKIHDVTNLDMDAQPPHSTQEYICDEYSQDKHVKIPSRDRDYLADLGYETADGRWLRLVRSLSVRISPNSASVS